MGSVVGIQMAVHYGLTSKDSYCIIDDVQWKGGGSAAMGDVDVLPEGLSTVTSAAAWSCYGDEDEGGIAEQFRNQKMARDKGNRISILGYFALFCYYIYYRQCSNSNVFPN